MECGMREVWKELIMILYTIVVPSIIIDAYHNKQHFMQTVHGVLSVEQYMEYYQ